MNRADQAGRFNWHGIVTVTGRGARRWRLPLADGMPLRAATAAGEPWRPAKGESLLPEMTTDLTGLDGGYAAENMRRDRSTVRWQTGTGWTPLVGRMRITQAVSAGRP